MSSMALAMRGTSSAVLACTWNAPTCSLRALFGAQRVAQIIAVEVQGVFGLRFVENADKFQFQSDGKDVAHQT